MAASYHGTGAHRIGLDGPVAGPPQAAARGARVLPAPATGRAGGGAGCGGSLGGGPPPPPTPPRPGGPRRRGYTALLKSPSVSVEPAVALFRLAEIAARDPKRAKEGIAAFRKLAVEHPAHPLADRALARMKELDPAVGGIPSAHSIQEGQGGQ